MMSDDDIVVFDQALTAGDKDSAIIQLDMILRANPVDPSGVIGHKLEQLRTKWPDLTDADPLEPAPSADAAPEELWESLSEALELFGDYPNRIVLERVVSVSNRLVDLGEIRPPNAPLAFSSYFVKHPQDLEALGRELGRVDAQPGYDWVACGFGNCMESGDLDASTSFISEQLSTKFHEMIFLFVDAKNDQICYEHAREGKLLRKLLRLSDGFTAKWAVVEGELEQWEESAIFGQSALPRAIGSDFFHYDHNLDEERGPEELERFLDDLRALYRDRQFQVGDIWPLADSEKMAEAITKHFGISIPVV